MAVQNSDYVRIFDTTLRDGEQSPGATMTSEEKLKVAATLARLGVDIIEAGFPAASPDDLAAVQKIGATTGCSGGAATPSGRPPVITGLARATKGDIDKAWEAVKTAERPRIHTFLATSDIHMKHKLRMTRPEVVARVGEMVAYAAALCDNVEFSPEDGGRSDPEFLYEVLGVAIAAGATTLNIPDTVGYTMPEEFGALIAGIIANTPGIEKAIVSTHCHNDLGLATANSLAGIRAGARQVEVAINGIGERAGNTSLEEVVMALHTRRPFYNLSTGIDTTQIMRASKLVSACTGIHVQPNKAIVGANAFAHEAGIHQDGMLKHETTYEIMRPETVGAAKSLLVLGKHSGRHAVRSRLTELGYQLSDEDLGRAFKCFKLLAEKKKSIIDADLEALIADELYRPEEIWKLDGIQVACGTMGMPTATVRLLGPDDQLSTCAAIGTGPVDAALQAIREIVDVEIRLVELSVQSVTAGIDALGGVTVKVQAPNPDTGDPLERDGSRTYVGYGANTDIVVASAKAYLAGVNKVLVAQRHQSVATA